MTLAVAEAVQLKRRQVYCYHLGCGHRLPVDVAGEGDVVLFIHCRKCKTLNIVEMRKPEC